jgi:putative heme-binding domain-containing protein
MPSIRFRAAATAVVSVLSLCAAFAGSLGTSFAQAPAKGQAKKVARKKADGPAPPAVGVEKIKAPKGFRVELIHTVPRDSQGSWVSLTTDPKGRLIASDQYGKLFRITPAPLGSPASETKVEALAVEIGEAQGLLWAFDSLYVVVNSGGKFPSGLYRVKDTNGDDQLDKVELLRPINGGGEHGPHGVVLSPDGKSLYIVAGNATTLPELSGSYVPRNWGEDNLLPRMTDGRGFMADEKAPGGFVCKVDPDGKNWELVSMGYRNAYDLAFNRDGFLFTYDSDMEWDFNTPWYRPTRVCDVANGSDFGYRNGAGKWPTYYFDSLPPVVNIGPGSPTGVSFGYGAKFPSKYQDALYISDWSYGKLYAVHLKPKGASYGADVEEFITGVPLPLTDVLVHPQDGSLYFTIGGRRTTSALYRVTYVGDESTAASKGSDEGSEARAQRRRLEAYHGHRDPTAVEMAWPFLSNNDRFLRYAARVAIEFQGQAAWSERALTETNPQAALEALLALTHVSAQDPAHRKPTDPEPNESVKGQILGSLDKLSWDGLSTPQRIDLVRVYSVLFNRMGRPDAATTARLIARFDAAYPAKSRDLNVELCNLLVYLGDPDVASKTIDLIAKAPTQEEQIDLARPLRVLKTGWTPALRKAYFTWLVKSTGFKGGASFGGFLANIKRDALATLSESEKAELKPILDAPAATAKAAVIAPRPHVKDWTLDELTPIVDAGLKQKRDFDRGRSLFAAASCFACHRFDNEGGAAGPDLTGVSGRFSTRDLLESVIVPSKVISDQYGAVVVSTTDGRVVSGRVVNLNNDSMSLNTNMLDPEAQVSVDRKSIEEVKPSPVSMMPQGLLNTLKADEVLDLIAYLMSRGDRENPMFR